MSQPTLGQLLAACGNPMTPGDEQRTQREPGVLLDQSHHMTEMTVTAPDALQRMSYLTINGFADFTPLPAAHSVVSKRRS